MSLIAFPPLDAAILAGRDAIFQFTDADLAQRMRVRAAFDPQWRLNPAKVFPPDGRAA
ncbi:MAG: hypothetical protein ABR878_10620 [Roseiarcus sp.]|jgi:FAD/FMN-containing dehydrogenase